MLGVASAVMAALGLCGWVFDVPALRSIFPGLGSMKPNTAAAILGVGGALWAQVTGHRRLALAGAMISLVIGASTLFEHLSGVDLGIDTLLVPAHLAGSKEAARLSLNASFSLLLGGLSVMILPQRHRAARALVQASGLIIGTVGFVGASSYLFSANSLRDVAGYGSMALHSATSFILLGSALLLLTAEHGVLRPLTQDTAAGAAARRLLPLLLITPTVLGWVRLFGQRQGLYGTEFGLSLMVTSCTLVLSALALWNAHLQGRDDRERMLVQRDERLVLELSELFRTATDRTDLLWQVATRMLERFGCTRAFFILADEVRQEATIVRDAHAPELRSIANTGSLANYPPAYVDAARRNQVFVTADLRADARFEQAYRPISMISRLAVPVARDGRWVGGLTISDSQPRPWSTREVALVREVAERTWLWLERLEALEALQHRERTLDETVKQRTSALKEREVLLQEIHHRVKNNLQIVSSLINMQARQVSDQQAQSALRECKARVEAIALIHEQLYQARDYARVPLSEYARSLANNVFAAGGAIHIKLELRLGDVSLAMDQAIPCGLILNELMTNAMKHAFPQGRAGTLTVELAQHDEQVRLVVSDDGVGLSGTEPMPTGSLGSQLIATLVRQLSGTLKTTSSPGATFEVTFPMAPTREAPASFQPSQPSGGS